MLNVSEAVKRKYLSDEFNGDYTLTIGNATYTGRNIQQGSLEITESLCSGDDIDFSSVEIGKVSLTLINFTEGIKDLQGKTLNLIQTVAGESVPIATGYIVVEAKNSGEYLMDIVAYDGMYKFQQNVTDWWNNQVTFPITHRNLLISLCNYCGVQYSIPATYCNSNVSIKKSIDSDEITGLEMIGWMQEVSVCFYRMNRYNVLTARTVNIKRLQPAVGLHPHTGLYPGTVDQEWVDATSIKYTVPQIVSDLEVPDYETAEIDKLQVSGTINDVGVTAGEGTNCYKIVSNPLLFSFSVTELEIIARRILNILKDIKYKPFTAKLKGLPYVETGDLVQVTTLKGIVIVCPLLNRTLSGSGLAYDKFECKGSEKRDQVTTKTGRNLRVLNQRTHEIINTVDTLSSTITDISTEVTANSTKINEHSTLIAQNSQEILLQAAEITTINGTVANHTTQITQSANSINLAAKRSGVFNLLTNSNFSNQSSRTQGWSRYGCTASYNTDSTFKNASADYNHIGDGYAMRVNCTVGYTVSSFYQEINYSGTIRQKLLGELTYRVNTPQGGTYRVFVRLMNGNTDVLYGYVGSALNTDGKTYNMSWILSDSQFNTVNGQTVTKIQYGIQASFSPALTTAAQFRVNNLLLTFGTEVLPSYSWTDYASKDVISQINIQPSGVTIQGEKVDIKGITTFSSSSDGTTVIDGGTVTVKNINASNIKSGTINSIAITGSTITGASINSTKQMVFDYSGTYSGTSYSGSVTAKAGTISTNLTANGTSYKQGLVYNGRYSSMNTDAPSVTTSDAIGFNSYNFVATGRNVYITGQYSNSQNAAGIAVEQADNADIRLILVSRYGSAYKRITLTKDNISLNFGANCWVSCNAIARIDLRDYPQDHNPGYRKSDGTVGIGEICFPCATGGGTNWPDW